MEYKIGPYTGITFLLNHNMRSGDLKYDTKYSIGTISEQKIKILEEPTRPMYAILDSKNRVICYRKVDIIARNIIKQYYINIK